VDPDASRKRIDDRRDEETDTSVKGAPPVGIRTDVEVYISLSFHLLARDDLR
jgi:hypothetical protein